MLCWSHVPHCWKCHVAAQISEPDVVSEIAVRQEWKHIPSPHYANKKGNIFQAPIMPTFRALIVPTRMEAHIELPLYQQECKHIPSSNCTHILGSYCANKNGNTFQAPIVPTRMAKEVFIIDKRLSYSRVW